MRSSSEHRQSDLCPSLDHVILWIPKLWLGDSPKSMPPKDAMAVSRYALRYVLMSAHTVGRSSFAIFAVRSEVSSELG